MEQVILPFEANHLWTPRCTDLMTAIICRYPDPPHLLSRPLQDHARSGGEGSHLSLPYDIRYFYFQSLSSLLCINLVLCRMERQFLKAKPLKPLQGSHSWELCCEWFKFAITVAAKLFTCEFGETTKPNKKYIFSIFIFNTLYQLLTFKPLQVVFPHIPTCCFEVWKWSEAGNFKSFSHLICPE